MPGRCSVAHLPNWNLPKWNLPKWNLPKWMPKWNLLGHSPLWSVPSIARNKAGGKALVLEAQGLAAES
jgi:hypothetical protein